MAVSPHAGGGGGGGGGGGLGGAVDLVRALPLYLPYDALVGLGDQTGGLPPSPQPPGAMEVEEPPPPPPPPPPAHDDRTLSPYRSFPPQVCAEV